MNYDQRYDKYLSDPAFQSGPVSCLESLERGKSLNRDELLGAHPNLADGLANSLPIRK